MPKLPNQKPIPSTLLFLLLPLIPFSIYLALPPKQPISPLSYSNQPEIVRQSLNQTKKSLTYYLAASKDYLEQTRQLANSTASSQTQAQKQQVISLLNQSLRSATNAIRHYPQNPQGYQQRAKVYLNITHLDPKAEKKAQKDLTIAQKLNQGDKLQEIQANPADLVNTQPLKEASLSDNVAIAFPEEKTSQTTKTKESSNAKKGSTVLKAGNTSTTVESSFVNAENLIYFTPQSDTQNEILSLSQKQTCKNQEKNCTPSFTLKLTNPLPFDLPITWWIVE